ncbi:hypothetical protein BDZ89DRAFT_1058727 [Hymenopellis radicata]|nr:hypothetical protein BDZ89DRAFT_1058727 [Hymenopellis radicata]
MRWTTILLACLPPARALWPFGHDRFHGNSLVDAGARGILTGERAVAFGDFNGDQFLDILMLDADQQTMIVYLWDHMAFEFTQSSSLKHSAKIYNVVPGDFTHSGKLDLLVMSASSSSSKAMDMFVYPALVTGGFDTNPIAIQSSTLAQPIPIDLDGDMKIDLLGVPADSTEKLQAWQNVWNTSSKGGALFSIIDPSFDGQHCTLANPHSNAVVDLDGDYVFLVCDNGSGTRSFQIWVNNKDSGFTLAQQGSLPSGVQAISFADVDRDGTIDMIFPTCHDVSRSTGLGRDCEINVVYNEQLPLCASADVAGGEAQGCRSPENLCVRDARFRFDLGKTVRFKVSEIVGGDLLVLDTTVSPAIPVPIKLGDANLDGFPIYLYSVPCGKGVAGCSAQGSGKRGWELEAGGADVMDVISDARGVAFVDMDEDGTLDVLVLRSGAEKVTFVQNNFYYDAFFLKAIVLNGACGNGWCYAVVNETEEKYHPFGVSYSGASYKYTVLDTSGRRSAAQIGQLPQTSYHALQTPYAFFGLGRTNNYIENLFVGSTLHASAHYINLEGVIPNSKVVISPGIDGEAWKRQLFLRPGKWIPWVTVTVVVGTGVLAIIVLVLHLSEKREDELERRRASHHINFDAL